MRTGFIGCALITSSSLCLAAPALAADAASAPVQASAASQSSDEPTTADIIVTARRTDERLQDVPISITVFNPQQLANRNVVNSQDLASYTPSLSANSNFGSENSSFAIRGFVQDVGTPPSVGVYFADVVAPRGATQGTVAGDGAGPGSFFDLQNVQVVKGPQGTLFGRNTTGGAVLFVPQKPTTTLEGYVEGSIGDYGMRREQGMLNLPLGDIARFRIAVDHQTRDGYITNNSGIGPRNFDNVDYTAVRGSLVVDLTPDLENYSILSYSNSDTNGDVQKVIACNPSLDPRNFIGQLSCAQLAQQKGTDFYTLQSDLANPESKLRQVQFINTTTWHASDTFTVKNIASYAELRDFDQSALFGTDWKLPTPVGPLLLPFASIVPIPGKQSADSSTITEELQLQGSVLDQRLTYQGGVYFETTQPLGLVGAQSPVLSSCSNLAALQCVTLIPGGSAVNYTGGYTYFHDTGLYAQSSYSLTDQLKLTGGLRGTWDSETNTSSRITYNFPQPNVPVPTCTDSVTTTLPTCTEFLREQSHAPTWLIDLDYKPTDDVLTYGKYSRGYRAGGVFANSPSNYRDFKPEKVDAYEAGVKTTFHGAVAGTFNVAAFYNNFQDQQLQVGFNAAPGSGVGPTTGIVNAGKSRIYGVEVETSISPFEGLTVDGSYTYLHATITSIAPLVSTDPNYVIASQIQPGDPLALSPKNKYSVTGTYTLPLNSNIGKVSVGATFTHTDKQLTSYAYNDPVALAEYGSNLGILAATNLLNLNLGWNSIAGAPVDMSVFATNVTQQKYYAFVPGLAQNGFESAVLGQPRMYGVRVRYRFGK